MNAPAEALDNPRGLADLLRKMQSGDVNEPVISLEEADEMATAISDSKKSPKTPTSAHNRGKWIPKGEGGSGNKSAGSVLSPSVKALSPEAVRSKAPAPPVVQTKPESLDEILGESVSDTEEYVGEDDPDHPPKNAVTPPEIPAAVMDHITAELDQTALVFSQYIEEVRNKIRNEVMGELELMKENAHEDQKAVQRLTAQVTALTARVQHLGKASPIMMTTLPVKAGQDVGEGKGVKVRPLSVSTVAEGADQREPTHKVEVFMSENKSYPKVMLVRKRKLGALAANLGVAIPKGDITPKQWTADGVLAFLLQEK